MILIPLSNTETLLLLIASRQLQSPFLQLFRSIPPEPEHARELGSISERSEEDYQRPPEDPERPPPETNVHASGTFTWHRAAQTYCACPSASRSPPTHLCCLCLLHGLTCTFFLLCVSLTW